MEDFGTRVRRLRDQLSPTERQVARTILGKYDDVPFLTVDGVASLAGVSPSTVVRLATRLGYDGYVGLQAAARSRLKERLSGVERVRHVLQQDATRGSGGSPSLDRSVNVLLRFRENLPLDEIRAASKIILDSDTVLVVGFRTAGPIANHLQLGLMGLLGHKIRLASEATILPEYVTSLTNRSTVIAFTFPRYVIQTLQAVRVAHQKHGARIIAITDSVLSPIAKDANVLIPCPFVGRAFQNSLIAAYACTDVLIEQVVAAGDSQVVEETEQRMASIDDVLKGWGWLAARVTN